MLKYSLFLLFLSLSQILPFSPFFSILKNNPKNSDFKLLHYRFFENPGGEASEVPPSSSVKEEVLGNQYMVDDKLVTSVSLAKIDWGIFSYFYSYSIFILLLILLILILILIFISRIICS